MPLLLIDSELNLTQANRIQFLSCNFVVYNSIMLFIIKLFLYYAKVDHSRFFNILLSVCLLLLLLLFLPLLFLAQFNFVETCLLELGVLHRQTT